MLPNSRKLANGLKNLKIVADIHPEYYRIPLNPLE